MADIKISQLGEALAVTDNDILPMTASGVTSKVKASTMKSYMVDDLDVSDLHDTTITTPTDDDGLVYDATAQKWENVPIMTKEQWKKNGAYNLLPNNGTMQSTNGIVFTVNSDGTVSISTGVGGATQSTAFILFEGVADWKNAKLTGCPSGGSITTTYDLFAYDTVTAGENYDIGNGVVLASIDNGHKIRVGIRVRAGFVATTPVVFKPMITTDLNATYADYVPYAMTNRELTEELKKTSMTAITGSSAKYTIYQNGNYYQSHYMIKDGWVFVNINVTCVTPSSSSEQIATLPLPDEFTSLGLSLTNEDGTDHIYLILQDGKLYARNGTAGKLYRGIFSYPYRRS